MNADSKVIVVGGGLSGLSTAHTILEQGGNVLLLDKSAYLGGNSTKATSGINGALTQMQINNGIKEDSREIFYEDAKKSAAAGARPALLKVLTYGSAPAVEWLQEAFGIDLSRVAMMGGHTFQRCHRGKERFPGAAITMQLMEAYDKVCEDEPSRAQLKCKARVTKLIADASGRVVGVEYTEKDGKVLTEHGPVVLCSGGFGADFSDTSLLAEVESDWDELKAFGDVPSAKGRLRTLPTTNGAHCTGDGIKMARELGAGMVDLEAVQVHPTGLIHPDDPKCKVRFLAAEALRGVGGLLLDSKGERFVDELQKRDFVTGRMWNNTIEKGIAPGDEAFALILNSKASKEIEWHCKHYSSRGLMKKYESGRELAAGLGVPEATIARVFKDYTEAARTSTEGNSTDKFGKVFFKNSTFEMNDSFHVGMIGPVVHYCMGGVEANEHSEVVHGKTAKVVGGLFAAGEVMGGVHGKNRLGGNSLLDCVVYGRVAGRRAAKYLLERALSGAANSVAAPTVVSAPVFSSAATSASLNVVAPSALASTTITIAGTTITIAAGQHIKLDVGAAAPDVAQVAAPAAASRPRPPSQPVSPLATLCSGFAALLVPPSDASLVRGGQ